MSVSTLDQSRPYFYVSESGEITCQLFSRRKLLVAQELEPDEGSGPLDTATTPDVLLFHPVRVDEGSRAQDVGASLPGQP